jgi:hypothetical protein
MSQCKAAVVHCLSDLLVVAQTGMRVHWVCDGPPPENLRGAPVQRVPGLKTAAHDLRHSTTCNPPSTDAHGDHAESPIDDHQ